MDLVKIWKRARLENNNDLYLVVTDKGVMIKEVETERIIKFIKNSNE